MATKQQDKLYQRLRKYMRDLVKLEHYDNNLERSVFTEHPFVNDMLAIICTNSAMMVAHKFGGKVYGYDIDEGDSNELIGYSSGGHDFAVVGDYLVDWWAENVECVGRAVLHLVNDKELINRIYKMPSEWRVVPQYELAKGNGPKHFRYVVTYQDDEDPDSIKTYAVTASSSPVAISMVIQFIDEHHHHEGEGRYALTYKISKTLPADYHIN
jgi:hypothetical protein